MTNVALFESLQTEKELLIATGHVVARTKPDRISYDTSIDRTDQQNGIRCKLDPQSQILFSAI